MKEFESTPIRYLNGKLEILDQRLLPHEETWIESRFPADMARYIQRLSVRGAPVIGIAAALALALYIEKGASQADIEKADQLLRNSRPTAVNLMYCLDRVAQADQLVEEEVRRCQQMAKHGAELIGEGEGILTHCNTGALVTTGIGTALGVIAEAHRQGKGVHVYVDETRPLLQGARLTAWELERLAIPYTLICDNMAAQVMREGRVQRVLVGADRIARNGDFANKIGTYSLAVLAHHHGIPFHPVAPLSTVDPNCPTGADIPIEIRRHEEVRMTWSPQNAPTYNPAFDVTPVQLVTSLILDTGIHREEAQLCGV